MKLKSKEKAVPNALQGPSASKIPVPFKSPRSKKTKRSATNNIICSTPLNTVKLHLFADANHQVSPIHNPSSATTSNNSSPSKPLNVPELENKLQITKIKMGDTVEQEKLIQIRKDSQDCEYIFPLVNTVPVLKMMICDSEEETLPEKSKRGKKPTKKSTSTNNIESKQKNTILSNEKTVIETKAVIEIKESIRTRSKTETILSDNKNIIQHENSEDNRTKQKKINSRPKSKKLKTSTSKNKQAKVLNENKNVETIHDAGLLITKNEKIKKDIINDKTKNSLNLKNSENKNNIENNYDDIFMTLKLRNIENINNNTKYDDDIFSASTEKLNENKLTDTKTFSKNTSERKKNKSKKEIDDLSSKKLTTQKSNSNSKILDIPQTQRKSCPTKTKKSLKNFNKTKNKTTNSNNNVETSDNVKIIKKSQSDGSQANKTENSNGDKHSLEIRKSERKRIPSSKYWVANTELSTSASQVEFKTPFLTNKRLLKVAGVANKVENIQNKPNVDKHQLMHNDSKNNNKLETSLNKRSLRLVEAAVGKKTTKIPDKLKIEEIPVAKEPLIILEKLQTNSSVSFDIKTKTPEKTKFTKDNMSRQSIQSSRRQSFRKTRTNESRILTAGKIRKSLAFEKKVATPKLMTKKISNLRATAKNTSYTTEEEDGIPRDTLLLNNVNIIASQTQMTSQQGKKRKVETNIELYQPKKVRLQTDNNEYSFQKMAIMADISPAKPGGLADVQINGNRCLLGCFGKFPRNCTTNSRNSDISVGLSIDNAYITTGIIEIEPAGLKNYEYAKKVDLLFVVLEGIAEVGIGNSSQVLRLGQDFYVPKDTPYYILNISNTNKLLLYFSKFSK